METLRLKPTKRLDNVLVQLKRARYPRDLRVIQLQHPIVLIIILNEDSLKLFYFNIIAFKSLKYVTIRVKLGKLSSIEPLLTLQHSNPSYFGVKTDQNLLHVYSLKTKKVVLEIKHPVPSAGFFSFFTKKEPTKPISLYSCFAGDQVITWAENSTKLCFWELSKKSKTENALTLSATPSQHYALIENRNLLVLQIDDFKYLEIIDVVKRVSLTKTGCDPVMKLNTPSTERNIYFFSEAEMMGITEFQIFPYMLNEKLEFTSILSRYEHTGPCPRPSVLTGGTCVTLNDIRSAEIIDFSGESPQPYYLSCRDCFDARGFIKIPARKLLLASGTDGSVWIWRV